MLNFYKRAILGTALGVSILGQSTEAQAQSSHLSHDYTMSHEGSFNRKGPEARLSFTLPFGGHADRRKTKPRLDFAIRNYASPPSRSTDWMLADETRFTEASLGFTLESEPQWMLNDQPLLLGVQDDQANIGTGGRIGLAIGAVVVVGATVVGAALIRCAMDCGDGE